MPSFFVPEESDINNSPDIFNLASVLDVQKDMLSYAKQNLMVPGGNSAYYSSGSDVDGSEETRVIRKTKRKRRLSSEISRIYKCGYPQCKKAYEKISHLKTHQSLKCHEVHSE